ncbi:type II secretion system protein [Shewanella sp. KX20019]|uniref:type II secretion system protein n=1 Tax=Shewanella sp. KX20019 TaxID=2803864 RepID=UPI002351D6A1|nr:type II secretion system protein [Shewanella sp. KX20019]
MSKIYRGFTLIELVVVIIILGILAVIAAPKFIDLRSDAELSVLKGMQGSLKSTRDLVAAQIALRPENLSSNNRSFTLDSGENIEVRGEYPDGRWSSTFAHIVDFDSVTNLASGNECPESHPTAWCVREKGRNWFNNRGYSSERGRGFVIFPQGNSIGNNNDEKCYLYYFTPNRNNVVGLGTQPIVELDLTDCS